MRILVFNNLSFRILHAGDLSRIILVIMNFNSGHNISIRVGFDQDKNNRFFGKTTYYNVPHQFQLL